MSRLRILGNGLKVSAVGLGCMGFTHAYGRPTDEEEATAAIRQAADLGYTFFDTAECYIGEREDGSTAYNDEFSSGQTDPTAIRELLRMFYQRASIDSSLKRLGTDYVDLYYQHRIDPEVEPEAVAEVMSDLMKEGKILHWGISEANEEYLRRAHAVCPVTCIQNRYSMMARWHEDLFPVLEDLNVGYVAFSPLANGILSGAFGKDDKFEEGDYRNVMPQYSEEGHEANKELLSLIRSMAAEKEATPAQISLAWMLCKKPYIVPIPGSRKTERIKENFGAADITLTKDEVAALDDKLDHMDMSGVFGGSPVKKDKEG